MIAEYMDSLVVYGAGFYRNLFWEAGLVASAVPRGEEAAFVRPGSAATSMIRFTRCSHLFARLAELLPFHCGWPSRGRTPDHVASVQLGEAG